MNRLKKNCDTHIYVCVCYSAMKKDEILPFATTWMDLEGINAAWNKSDKERQILYDLIVGILKKKNSLIRFIDTENRLVVAIGILGWEVGEMGEGYQKGQISSYIMNKSWEYNVQYGCYS